MFNSYFDYFEKYNFNPTQFSLSKCVAHHPNLCFVKLIMLGIDCPGDGFIIEINITVLTKYRCALWGTPSSRCKLKNTAKYALCFQLKLILKLAALSPLDDCGISFRTLQLKEKPGYCKTNFSFLHLY